MKDDSPLIYEEMPPHVRKIFMLGMQLCVTMNEMAQTKEQVLKFVEECWVTMNLNLNKGTLSDLLNSMMISDLNRLADEIGED